MPPIRVRYQTIELDDTDIHVRSLRDNQQFSDESGEAEKLGISSASWPLFGVVWPSSVVLAHLMLSYEIAGLRVLEVGCGIGLSSLVLNHRQADITATDYHPSADAFLQKNALLNGDEPIPFVRTGWADAPTNLGLFDLIVGSEILYEVSHSGLLSAFIDQHAKAKCEVIIVDPGRGERGRFNRKMAELGYEQSLIASEYADGLSPPFAGHILRYVLGGSPV